MDFKLFQFIHAFAGKHWLSDWLFVFLAQYLGYILVLAAAFFIFWNYKTWRDRLYYLFFSIFSLLVARGLVVETIRFFSNKSRPFGTLNFEPLIESLNSSSLPSGHAAVFFALATLMFYIKRKYFWYFLIGAFLIGIGRIVVGMHWPFDILLGAAIGVASVLAARLLLPPPAS